MRPTPFRINRTPSRMRASNFFWRKTATQKEQLDTQIDVKSPLQHVFTPITKNTEGKAA